jgi:hypothetical protein
MNAPAACANRGEFRIVKIIRAQAVTRQPEVRDQTKAAGTRADYGDRFNVVCPVRHHLPLTISLFRQTSNAAGSILIRTRHRVSDGRGHALMPGYKRAATER